MLIPLMGRIESTATVSDARFWPVSSIKSTATVYGGFVDKASMYYSAKGVVENNVALRNRIFNVAGHRIGFFWDNDDTDNTFPWNDRADDGWDESKPAASPRVVRPIVVDTSEYWVYEKVAGGSGSGGSGEELPPNQKWPLN